MDDKTALIDSLGVPLLNDLEQAGLTRSRLIELLKEELLATERKVFNNNGNLIYSDPAPAWEIRQKARLDIQKLCGFYPTEKHLVEAHHIQISTYARFTDDEIKRRINGIVSELGAMGMVETPGSPVKDIVETIDYQSQETQEKEKPADLVKGESELREPFNPGAGYPRFMSNAELSKVRKLTDD